MKRLPEICRNYSNIKDNKNEKKIFFDEKTVGSLTVSSFVS